MYYQPKTLPKNYRLIVVRSIDISLGVVSEPECIAVFGFCPSRSLLYSTLYDFADTYLYSIVQAYYLLDDGSKIDLVV